MSDLIQQLSDKAKESVPKNILAPDQWIQEYNRIFAALIIKECAGQFSMIYTDEQYQRRIDKTILKHFGLYA